MSDNTVSGCIQHKDTRYIQVRCDYLHLYQGNEHKAKLVRILESWTDSKREQWYKNALEAKEQKQDLVEPDFWITMSHQQFRQFLYETVSVDTIKANLAELISQDKHIERRINPDNPYGPPQYRLIIGAIQKGLDKLGTPPLIPRIPSLEEDTPPGKTTPPPGVKNPPTQGGECPPPPQEKQPLGEGGKTATSKSSVSKNPSKNPSKNNEVGVVLPEQGTPTQGTPTPEKPPQKKYSYLALLDHWDKSYGASPRPKWVVEEAKDMASRMEATPEQMDIVCAKLKTLGKALTFESMYNHWHLLKQQEGPPERKPGQPPGKANNPANNLVALAAAQRAKLQQAAGGGQ